MTKEFPFHEIRKGLDSRSKKRPVPPKSIIDIGEDTSINPSKPQPEEPATLICGTCCLEVCNYKENGNSIINWIKRRLKK